MNEQPWYIKFFNENYLQMHTYAFPDAHTKHEVDGIIHLLNLSQGAKILDLCCGWGRHAIELARRGYDVTGFDLSNLFLQRARADAARVGVKVRWMQGDMREIPFEDEFDAIINLYNSFGYLENEDEDQQVLNQVYKAIKPDGLFLQQVGNREAFIRTYQSDRSTRLPNDLIIIEEREFDMLMSHLLVSITMLYPDGRRTLDKYCMRMYSLTELTKMLRIAGLEPNKYFGRLDGSNLTLDSAFLIMLSHKCQ